MGDKSKGWVLLYRSIRDSWIWEKKPFDPARAWIDLILDANHDDGKVFTGSSLMKIKRGQDWVSVRSLAERWGWSKDRVRKFLKTLESDSMIRINTTPFGTLLTVVNYDNFQIRQDSKRDTKKTPTRTQTGRKPVRNKEGLKEELKERKESDLPSEEEIEDLTAWEELEDDDATAEH
jgi:DNA replication protein DnaD